MTHCPLLLSWQYCAPDVTVHAIAGGGDGGDGGDGGGDGEGGGMSGKGGELGGVGGGAGVTMSSQTSHES